jgi:hypothetical protein
MKINAQNINKNKKIKINQQINAQYMLITFCSEIVVYKPVPNIM